MGKIQWTEKRGFQRIVYCVQRNQRLQTCQLLLVGDFKCKYNEGMYSKPSYKTTFLTQKWSKQVQFYSPSNVGAMFTLIAN